VRDYPSSAKREHAVVLFEDMLNVLDSTREGDATRFAIQELRREFNLDDEVTTEIAEYQRFLERLEQIQYTARLTSQMD